MENAGGWRKERSLGWRHPILLSLKPNYSTRKVIAHERSINYIFRNKLTLIVLILQLRVGIGVA